MLAAAVAAGTTAAFGAPTAGMIFSIEIATTYYMISNLWKAFCAAIFCIITFRYIEVFQTIELFDKT
jgi:H+/Cl- antiporter ClcA